MGQLKALLPPSCFTQLQSMDPLAHGNIALAQQKVQRHICDRTLCLVQTVVKA